MIFAKADDDDDDGGVVTFLKQIYSPTWGGWNIRIPTEMNAVWNAILQHKHKQLAVFVRCDYSCELWHWWWGQFITATCKTETSFCQNHIKLVCNTFDAIFSTIWVHRCCWDHPPAPSSAPPIDQQGSCQLLLQRPVLPFHSIEQGHHGAMVIRMANVAELPDF